MKFSHAKSIIQSTALIIIFISVFYNETKAQHGERRFATSSDAVIDSSQRRIPSRGCNQWSSYVPDTLHPEFCPMRYVRINVHVVQDAEGRNNFSESQGRKWINEVIDIANQHLEKNQKMLLPHGNTTAVLPIPFRYVITGDPKIPHDDGIYFHRDDTLFCMNKKAHGKQLNSIYDVRQFKTYGIQKDSVINIFLIEHCPDSLKSKTYKASNDGIGTGNWAKLAGSYYLTTHPVISQHGDTSKFNTWDAAALLNHELGHCLGLQHTWNTNDGCDDTPENPGCWNFNEPSGCTNVSNDVMDYNAYKNAYSPCQISKIIQNFYNDKSSRKYLKPDWCSYDSAKTIVISSGETIEWNGSMDVFGNLIVENNASLTVRCTLSMPPGSRIILYPKATLILDGCIVTSRCTNAFEGIEVIARKKFKPVIHFENGAVIQNANHPI